MNKTILCIEDENCLRVDLADELTYHGFNVITACNGKDGLTQLSITTPDLVISDIAMPIMDGYEFLAAVVKSESGTKRLPIILLSAYDEDEVKRKCVSEPKAIMKKPVDYQELIQSIERILST